MAEGKAPARGVPAGATKTDSEAVRRGGIRAVGAALPSLVRNVFRKQGFASTEIVTRWSAIVGERVARHSVPERITFPANANNRGTLHIRVDGPSALELQHLEPQVIERINAYYGYDAISHLALRQGRLPASRRPPKPKARALTLEARAALDAAVADTADDGLKSALEALGKRILERDPRP